MSKRKIDLPDKLPVLKLYASTAEKEMIEVASEYNQLSKEDPKRKELYERFEGLKVEDMFD